MQQRAYKLRVLGKLRSARNELEDALNMTAAPSLHDTIVLPEPIRKELSVMVNDLNRMLLQLESMP